jgi:tetratricopeptide (TPR) repeat protein
VRRLVIACALVAALAGQARSELVAEPSRPAPDPDRGDFWRDLVSPHKDEVDSILAKARTALQTADVALYSDYDPTGDGRARFYREVNAMLRYARRLAPDNLEVLRLYAQTSDELGKTRQAVEALQTAIDLTGPDKAGPDLAGRLGIIYLRLGQLDDAIRYLRIAQGAIVPNQMITAHVLVHLAGALARRGQTAEAIDVLANSLPAAVPYYSNEVALVTFALAVQYDRDDQRGAAFEVLDRMLTVLQNQLGTTLQNSLAAMRFAPAEDQHYYQGLLYEAVGNYTEARAEWALYAAGPELPYRARALEHISAIDAQRRAPAAATPTTLPFRPHHRPPPVSTP